MKRSRSDYAPTVYRKDCVICGEYFESFHKETICCGKSCGARLRAQRRRKPFKIARIRKPKQCDACRNWFVGIASKKACSQRCAYEINKAAQRRLHRIRSPFKAIQCSWCSVLFTPLNRHRKYCSDQCVNNSAGGAHSTRAGRYGVAREHVNKRKVFEAAGYRCQRCGAQCAKTHSNQPDSPELDHIIPLSRGGTHTYSNVQLLCRGCNGAKGDAL